MWPSLAPLALLTLVLSGVNATFNDLHWGGDTEHFSVALTREGGTDTWSIEPGPDPIPRAQFGWVALGFGSNMTDSSIVLMWPNDDGSMTLSQRKTPSPTERTMPVVDPQPPRVAVLDETSVSDDKKSKFAFRVPSSEETAFPLIMAYSDEKVGSADPAAPIHKHIWTGHMNVTLTVAAPTTSGRCKPKRSA